MPLMDATFMIDTYTTDFGTEVKNLNVKMLDGFRQRLADEYVDRVESLCGGTGGLFRPRALVATFEDGKRVRYPIGDRTNLTTRIQTLKAEDAICIDYEGEYWTYVPNSLFGNISYRTTPLGGVTNDGTKKTGTFTYTSDILGAISQPFNFESTPAELTTLAEACVSNLVEFGFCTGAQSTGVRARRFRGKGLVDGVGKRTYARDIKVSDAAPNNCAGTNAPGYFCFSYIGEVIKNVHLLVD